MYKRINKEDLVSRLRGIIGIMEACHAPGLEPWVEIGRACGRLKILVDDLTGCSYEPDKEKEAKNDREKENDEEIEVIAKKVREARQANQFADLVEEVRKKKKRQSQGYETGTGIWRKKT